MPKNEIKLNTSLEEFEELHRRLERSKKGTKMPVDKGTLLRLLMDHSIMAGALHLK